MPIKAKERDALIKSLRAGVVPRTGQHLIQVGRSRELDTLIKDIEHIAESGSTFRLVIGEYGSGKTFFLNLVRAVSLEKKMVVTNADLTPDRRLQATGGQARTLYAELMRNLSTRTKPDGGALPGIVEKFVSAVLLEANTSGQSPEASIYRKLENLSEMVGGYDFGATIAAYWKGFESGDDKLKANAIRWLRGEFSTKTEARAALGVRTIVDDGSFYDHLKLLSRFARLAGYSGLVICLDELVNLYKLSNTQARNANYEQILHILNDSLQGISEGVGFLLAGTSEFLLDTRRGLYSYPALQSRLAENTFAKNGLIDLTGPVLRLANLSAEEFFVLLQKLRDVYAFGDASKYLLPDEALPIFMEHCHKRIGEAYFRTPRTTIKAFINLLAILEQNPGANWKELLGKIEVQKDAGGASEIIDKPDGLGSETGDDELADFKL
ncbi:MAG: ATP-binding protein [Candidatus Aminicenantales bacterium]